MGSILLSYARNALLALYAITTSELPPLSNKAYARGTGAKPSRTVRSSVFCLGGALINLSGNISQAGSIRQPDGEIVRDLHWMPCGPHQWPAARKPQGAPQANAESGGA